MTDFRRNCILSEIKRRIDLENESVQFPDPDE